MENEAGEDPDGANGLSHNSAQIDAAEEDMEVDQAEVTSYTLFRYMHALLEALHRMFITVCLHVV